jgi:hypothetical protein
MAKMESTYVRCPFYQWEEGIKLCCCYGDGADIRYHSIFATKQQRIEYERRFCKREWKKCPLARSLYEGDNNV